MNTIEGMPVHASLNSAEKTKLILLLCTVLLFSVMNGTMFMIAVPDIADYFSLTSAQVSWVVTGYIIFYAVGALMYGKLADVYPLKILLTVGLSLFSMASLIGFIAPNYIIVVAARMLQAIGAAAVPALVFIAPTRYFPNEKGRVLGVVSSTMAFASGVGPVFGGFISGLFNWQYLFLVSVFVIGTVPFFWMWMPKEERREGKVDIPGAALIAVGMALFILFITTFQITFLLISFLFFALFTWRIFSTDQPFIRPGLFADTPFRTVIITSFLGILSMFSMMFMFPLLLREVNGLNTQFIGLVLFPGAMAAAVMGRVAGKLTDRFGSRPVVYTAFSLMGGGFFLLSVVVGQPAWLLSIVMIVSYVAFPFFQTSTANLTSSVLPASQTGIGMGIYNLCNFMSGAFGSAVIGKMLDQVQTGWALNPFSGAEGAAAVYSNIFLGLVGLILLNAGMFHFVFRRRPSR